ncbi:Bug family tripartite tricarboxylate transporter substrate binding protein [Sabulicella rubraurantiaca]|uniref:Bug family tripartite tricarboxylate transporter substrate binding protein n=1 Tax=Sabulicella rubraurantiaca TaxID=2811429 RepID=UPI001A96D172|nr:tripartite tricarboxylate transporter substrate binding protein [Sabulicella rubraurantiaca]
MTHLTRRGLLGTAGSLLALPAFAAFPDRPIRIISGYPPGGLNDVVARAMAPVLTPLLGQAVVVENRPGAGGAVGGQVAARATPDGHTLWMGIVDTQAILPTAMRALSYDPDRDFAPISFVTNAPFALVSGPSRPTIQDFAGLMAAAKVKREEVTYASWGVASTPHLAMERVNRQQGVEMLHVPYTGAAPALQAVMAGQVDCMFIPAGAAEGAARDGKLRVLAVAAKQRVALYPEAPTILELGGPLDAGLWKAIYAPARTPAPVITQLNEAVHAAMRQPAFVEVLRQQGAVPEPSSPEALGELQRRERVAWGDVVRAANAYL